MQLHCARNCPRLLRSKIQRESRGGFGAPLAPTFWRLFEREILGKPISCLTAEDGIPARCGPAQADSNTWGRRLRAGGIPGALIPPRGSAPRPAKTRPKPPARGYRPLSPGTERSVISATDNLIYSKCFLNILRSHNKTLRCARWLLLLIISPY